MKYRPANMKYRPGQILKVSHPIIGDYYCTYLGFVFSDVEQVGGGYVDLPAVYYLTPPPSYRGQVVPVEDVPFRYWEEIKEKFRIGVCLNRDANQIDRTILEARLIKRFQRYKAFKAAKAAGLIFQKVKLKNQ